MATAKTTNKAKTTKATTKNVTVVENAGDVEKKTEVVNENLEVKNDVTEFVETVNPETQKVERKVNWIHRHI